jgi:hypothetical protein
MIRTLSMGNIPYSGSDTTRPGTRPNIQSTSAYKRKPSVMENPVVSKLPTDEEIRNSWKNAKSINDGLNTQVTYSDWKRIKEQTEKEIDNKIKNVTKAQKAYILSPLFKQRASKYKNPTEASSKALQALQELKTDISRYNREQAYPSRKLVTLNPDSEASVIAHEFGHMVGARPGSESGTAMVLNYNEQAEIMSRNKHVQKLAQQTGKPILRDSQIPIPIDKSNTHTYSPWENKADIDGMRFIFYKNGITKKYGDNITPEQFKKALENPKIKNELQIKRLKENFEEKDIIQLNNMLAKTNIAEQQNLA